MKRMPRLSIALLATVVGVLAAASSSARIGRRVWSPRVFAWRNFLRRRPGIEFQPDAPLLIMRPKFYSFIPYDSSIGSVLEFGVKNVSGKPVHSFTVSYKAAPPFHGGAFGCQPREGLKNGESQPSRISARDKDIVSLSVDFALFADGTAWCADPPKATVKPAGVRAGAQAAAKHLLQVLESGAATAVLDALPRIHADVFVWPVTATREVHGSFGFYCGVTQMGVRVQYTYREGGLDQVEAVLRQISDE